MKTTVIGRLGGARGVLLAALPVAIAVVGCGNEARDYAHGIAGGAGASQAGAPDNAGSGSGGAAGLAGSGTTRGGSAGAGTSNGGSAGTSNGGSAGTSNGGSAGTAAGGVTANGGTGGAAGSGGNAGAAGGTGGGGGAPTFGLTVAATGPAGSVSSLPAGQITCTAPNSGGACTRAYPSGTLVTLNATPANGSLTRFGGWSGACTGIVHTCTVTMDAAKSVTASFVSRSNNLVFVSSATYLPNLQSAVAYDAKCNQLASAAGINNTSGDGYIAWTSDVNSNAATRLGTAQGFILLDGHPFATTQTTLLTGNAALNPIRLTETGVDVGQADVMTGTNELGKNGDDSFNRTCNEWTGGVVPSDQVLTGSTLAGPIAWTTATATSCTIAKRIYCFNKTETATLAVTPVTGKRIWLSTQYSGTTAATPDAHCALALPTGVTGALALVAYSSAPASDVLGSTTTYVRPDGVLVGTGAEIVAETMHSGVWQSADGSYISKLDNGSLVFTGATNLTVNGANTCSNWQDQSATGKVTAGDFRTISQKFWNSVTITGCNVSSKLYCVQP